MSSYKNEYGLYSYIHHKSKATKKMLKVRRFSDFFYFFIGELHQRWKEPLYVAIIFKMAIQRLNQVDGNYFTKIVRVDPRTCEVVSRSQKNLLFTLLYIQL